MPEKQAEGVVRVMDDLESHDGPSSSPTTGQWESETTSQLALSSALGLLLGLSCRRQRDLRCAKPRESAMSVSLDVFVIEVDRLRVGWRLLTAGVMGACFVR